MVIVFVGAIFVALGLTWRFVSPLGGSERQGAHRARPPRGTEIYSEARSDLERRIAPAFIILGVVIILIYLITVLVGKL